MDAPTPTVSILLLLVLLVLAGGLFLLIKATNVGFLAWFMFFAVAALGLFAIFGLRLRQVAVQGDPSERFSRKTSLRDMPEPLFLRKGSELDAVRLTTVDEYPVIDAVEASNDGSASTPGWVNAAPRLDDDGNLELVIHSGQHARILECEVALTKELRDAASDYIDRYVEHGKGRDVRGRIRADELRKLVVTDEFVEVRKHSFGEVNYDIGDMQDKMIQVHQRLRFGPKAHDTLWKWARESVVEQRLWTAGFVVSSVLLLLATLLGCLSIDRATEGKYRRRLGLGATAVGGLLGGGAWFFMA